MRFSYGFDIGVQEITLPDLNFMAELNLSELPGRLNGEPEMRRAMAEPIGSPRLRACAKSGNKVVIISSLEKGDDALPDIMPAILDELYTGGVRRNDITLLLPYDISGISSSSEFSSLIGERTLREISVKSIDLNDTMVVNGPLDLPEVKIYKDAAEADLRVLIGNTQYHHYLGFTGGSETLISTCCPCSSRNVLLTVDNEDRTAPVVASSLQKERYDAIAKSVGKNFSINMIRGTDGSIKSVCTGDILAAHREGTRYLNAMCLKMLPCPADVVVVSAGGAPSDNNLLRALPALDHATAAVREGGTIIFIASCKYGFGSEEFISILESVSKTDELFSLPTEIDSDIREGCSILALSQKKCTVWFVSEQSGSLFDKIFPNRKSNAQAALDAVLSKTDHGALVLSIPYGLHTVPVLAAEV